LTPARIIIGAAIDQFARQAGHCLGHTIDGVVTLPGHHIWYVDD
jgi:hypothetical protein